MLSVWCSEIRSTQFLGGVGEGMRRVFWVCCIVWTLLYFIASWSRVILYGHLVTRGLIFCPHERLLDI